MRLAVTSRGASPESPVDERFGRAYWLLIHDSETGGWQAIDNGINRNALCGAGKATAKTLIDREIELLITGETGPKAFRTLQMAGIAIFHQAHGSVQEAVEKWRAGKLTAADAANEIGSPYCLMGEKKPVARIVNTN